jgi:predicted phosphoribosyltransferase
MATRAKAMSHPVEIPCGLFRDRGEAALRLAARLKGRAWHEPLILAIPRGGVVTGAVLARELGGELDVVLSRKLRAPGQPELAVGAVSEDGRIYLNPDVQAVCDLREGYLTEEYRQQMAEIARRKKLYRSARPRAPMAGRSVLVTDDGIATGATLIAALQAVKIQNSREVIVAVPVASPDRLEEVRRWCDRVVCLRCPDNFWSVGQFYEDFTQVEDEQVLNLLRESSTPAEPERVPGDPRLVGTPAP